MNLNKKVDPTRLLIDGFIESVTNFPDRPALDVDNIIYSYAELAKKAGLIAETIYLKPNSEKLVGVLAHKSETAFAGILGSLLSGNAFVPLQPHHPVDRIRRTVEISQINTIIVGLEGINCLVNLIQGIDQPLRCIIPCADISVLRKLKKLNNSHEILGAPDISANDNPISRPNNTANDVAYVIFTSGSTGDPKGVEVRNKNVVPFVDYMAKRCNASSSDRFSQISDLTFDLSIFPVWTCWNSGACLCSADDKIKLAPSKFIKDKQITVWTSVPSAIVLQNKMRLLKASAYPSIRYSFFCGEALPAESARVWQTACPNSVVENMYGPTEATCAITGFQWTGDDTRCANGIVPIGWTYPNQKAAIVSRNLRPVPPGVEGELCLSGTQVVEGYLKDTKNSSEKFIKIDQLNDEVWYRTGDLAVKAEDGCFFFKGRVDFQVKVLGHRVELEEVEHVIRETIRNPSVVCLPWPVVGGTAQGLVVFAINSGNDHDEKAIIEACRKSLPSYMVPKRVIFIATLPLNINGKIDRKKLITILEDRGCR